MGTKKTSNNYLTLVTTVTYCNKRISINKVGDAVKSSKGIGALAEAKTCRVDNLEAMRSLLEHVSKNVNMCIVQGFVAGTEPVASEKSSDSYQIMSVKAIETATGQDYTQGWVTVDGKKTIARLRANMQPSSWIQFDRDYSEGLPEAWHAMTDTQWLAAIDTFSPGVAKAGYVRIDSTSSRVLLDGTPMAGRGCRYWMQIADPQDYQNYGQRLKLAAAASGYGAIKSYKSKVGVLWSLFDPTVFSWERISYDGMPKVTNERLTVLPARIDVHAGGVVDSSLCALVSAQAAERIKQQFRVVLTDKGGVLSTVSNEYLTLATRIDTQEGTMTVKEFLASSITKVRCQATFRESDSWNGFLAKDTSGNPFLYDNGTHTRYVLSDDGKAAVFQMSLPKTAAAVSPTALSRANLPDCEMGENGPLRRQVFTMPNCVWVMDRLGLTARLNMMTHQVEISGGKVEMTQLEYFLLILDALTRLGITGDRGLPNVLEVRGATNAYHPMKDWMDGLTWDGHDHIAALSQTVTTTTSLWPVYLRKWLIQVAAGVCDWERGGQQLPHVLVLSGGHGLGKSTWFSNLLPPRFFMGEASLHLNGPEGKDSKLAALSRSVVELAEIETTFSKSAQGALKSFISTTIDTIRAPYGRAAVARARTTSFCGTVNTSSFLVDATGNRRFWPVEATAIMHKHQVDLKQVWAQARYCFEQGDTFYLSAQETEAHRENSDAHRDASEIEERFLEYFDDALLATDKNTWAPMRMTEVMRLLRADGDMRSQRSKSELSELLTAQFGKHRKYKGQQKVRLMPYRPTDKYMLNSTTGDILPFRGPK